MRSRKLPEKTAPIVVAPDIFDRFATHIDGDEKPSFESGDGLCADGPLPICEAQIPIGGIGEFNRSQRGERSRQARAFGLQISGNRVDAVLAKVLTGRRADDSRNAA
ncbi:hypothetical protein [Methylocella sp.]|uniref:hypothetical protein n=1 Tax=Methylocella sp. TaxID=1978226 RepID=UPI003C1C49BC